MNTGFPLQILLPGVISLLMLGVGMSLQVHSFTALFHARNAAVVAFIAQFLLLPLSAFILASTFDLPAVLQVGVVLLAACPSASTSTFFTYLARGDTALSIALTTFNKLFAVITLPVYVELASRWFTGEAEQFSLPTGEVFLRLVAIVLLPTAAGVVLRQYRPGIATRLQPHVKRAAILLLIMLVVWIVIRERDALPAMFLLAGPVMLLLCLLNMSLGFLVASYVRLSPPQRTAIVLETGMQSGGMAILIATGILGSASMAIPAVVYSLFMYPLAGAFVWQQNARA